MPEPFNAWVKRLEQAANMDIPDLAALPRCAPPRATTIFHQHGCRLSDHGLDQCYAEFCPETHRGRHFRAGAARAGRLRRSSTSNSPAS